MVGVGPPGSKLLCLIPVDILTQPPLYPDLVEILPDWLRCPPGGSEMLSDWLPPQRLKNWEIRERKKARDYSKETERDEERRKETVSTRRISAVGLNLNWFWV